MSFSNKEVWSEQDCFEFSVIIVCFSELFNLLSKLSNQVATVAGIDGGLVGGDREEG